MRTMQHYIPLLDIRHTICCLALTLSCSLISFFLMDKKIQHVTIESGLPFTRIVYMVLTSKHKTSLEQLHYKSNSLTATEMSDWSGERVFTYSHPTGEQRSKTSGTPKFTKSSTADGQRPTRTVNRSELQVCSKPKPKLPPGFPPRVHRHPSRINRVPPSERSGDSSDDSDNIFIAFRTPRNATPIPVAEPERPPLHCSARLNKGQHANPYRQLRTIS